MSPFDDNFASVNIQERYRSWQFTPFLLYSKFVSCDLAFIIEELENYFVFFFQ